MHRASHSHSHKDTTLASSLVQQQDHVHPPTGVLEVGMAFAMYLSSLNFMCKSHENGCTWSLGACCSTRTRSSTTRKTRHSTYHPTNGQKKKTIPSSLDLCDLRSEKKLYNPSTKSN